MTVVVSDASPLIGLAKGECLHLLPSLFDRILVPPAVWNEVVSSPALHPDAVAIRGCTWLEVVAPGLALPHELAHLGRGESEAIALARDTSADALLTDDALAIRVAKRWELSVLRTVDVLVAARKASVVTAIRPILDQMRARGFGIPDQLYAEVIQRVAE